MSDGSDKKSKSSTLAALLHDKPKRGRPRRSVSRENIYVILSPAQKEVLKQLAARLPSGLARADVPDLAITILAARLDALRRAVADRNREIPEGVTDLESLYLLWDLPLPEDLASQKWTTIRVSPQEAIELGRAHGALNAVFGANRSQTFALALSLLQQHLSKTSFQEEESDLTLAEIRERIRTNYL